MPVYCGSEKVWRILNLDTGTVYSSNFVDAETAFTAIKEGEVRAGKVVKAISYPKANACVDYFFTH